MGLQSYTGKRGAAGEYAGRKQHLRCHIQHIPGKSRSTQSAQNG